MSEHEKIYPQPSITDNIRMKMAMEAFFEASPTFLDNSMSDFIHLVSLGHLIHVDKDFGRDRQQSRRHAMGEIHRER